MERVQFTTHMARLFGYFGKNPTEVTLTEWWRELQKVPDHICHEAVSKTVRYQRTMPTLGEFAKTIGELQPNRKFREEEAKVREPSAAELAFGAEMMPVLGRMVPALTKAQRAGNDEKVREIWGAACVHMYGLALKHRIAHLMKWEDLEIHGFKVPAAWVRTGEDQQFTSEPQEDDET